MVYKESFEKQQVDDVELTRQLLNNHGLCTEDSLLESATNATLRGFVQALQVCKYSVESIIDLTLVEF